MATATQRAEYTKYDPEFAELLKKLPAPPPMSADIASIRAVTAERSKAKGKYFEFDTSGVESNDIQIPSRDGGSIAARVYRLKTPTSAGSPLITMFHGGGFCLGNLDSEDLSCRLFTTNFGAVCVNVEYRLAPEHPFPAAPNDAWDAVKWIAANATSSLGADPSKGFVVGGVSAGGNLTDVVGHLARDEKLSPPLTGLLEIIPALCPQEATPAKYRQYQTSYQDNAEAAVLPKDAINLFMTSYNADSQSPLFASLNWPNGHAGLPPVCFMICGADPLRDEALIYEKVLREEYGAKTRLTVYPGFPHGFWSFFPMLKKSLQFVNDEIDAMKWLLEQKS